MTFNEKFDAISSIVNNKKKNLKNLKNILCEKEDNFDDTFESGICNNHCIPRKDYFLNNPYLYFQRCKKRKARCFWMVFSHGK